MKQITPEIKARIAALYYGQSIMQTTIKNNPNDLSGIMRVEPLAFMEWDSQYFLNVASLSSITDEDAIEVCRLGYDDRGDEKYKAESGKALLSNYIRSSHCNVRGEWWIEIADYLRSRGYALPYMDWSVDELVGAGVFKIKEVNND